MVAKAQGVGQIVKRMEEGEVLLFPTWVEHQVPPHVAPSSGRKLKENRKKKKKKKKKKKVVSNERVSVSFNSKVVRVAVGRTGPLTVRFVGLGGADQRSKGEL